MDVNKIKDSLDPWIRVSTWYTAHPSDEKRFHNALRSAFISLGTSISVSDFRQAMQELVETHHPGLIKAEEIQQNIQEMAQRAEHIGSYLSDAGGI